MTISRTILSNQDIPQLTGNYSLKIDTTTSPTVVPSAVFGVGFQDVYSNSSTSSSFKLDVTLTLTSAPVASAIGVQNSVLSFDTVTNVVPNNIIEIYSQVSANRGTLTSIGVQNTTLRGREGNDSITIEARLAGNPSVGSLAVAADNSLVTGNAGDDLIDIRAFGSNSLAARNSRIFGGAGNDVMRLTSTSSDGVAVRDSFIWGRDGDDDLLINGSVQYSRQFTSGVTKMGQGIVGDAGFDTLRLPYLTREQFLSTVTVGGVGSLEFSLQSSQGVKYSGWERLVCANNEVVDLTQLVA